MPSSGWYPDPYDDDTERWWDGAGWTQNVRSVLDFPPPAPRPRPPSSASLPPPTPDSWPAPKAFATEPGPPVTRPNSGAQWWPVAALAVLIFTSAVGWWAGSSSTNSTEAPAVQAPTPPPPQVDDAAEWQRIEHPTAVFGGAGEQLMSALTAGDSGLVAVGTDEGRDVAAVWTSPDGQVWERVDHDWQTFSRATAMNGVARGADRFVAVGADSARQSAAVWTSRDGQHWRRVAHVDSRFGGGGIQVMLSVDTGGAGFVAVGADAGEAAAAVWTSMDGGLWQHIAHDEAVFGGDGVQMMNAVVAGGPGYVAVGTDLGRGAAAVWTSPDGLDWQRVRHDEAVFGGDGVQMISSVTAGGPGLVAVGIDGMATAVWTSSDGLLWERVAGDQARFMQASMNSVVAGGPGLVAVGFDVDRETAAVWTSPDGHNWQRVAHHPVFGDGDGHMMSAATRGGAGLVAVGAERNRGAAVWTSP